MLHKMTKKTTITDLLISEFKSSKRSVISGIVSINDLKEKEDNSGKLSEKEKLAVHNYDCYRLEILKSSEDDEKFQKSYEKLQVLANLRSYEDFLTGKF